MEITKKQLKSFDERSFPEKICFEPIGHINTPFKSLKGIPIQFYQSEAEGVIRIKLKFSPGLKDLEGFSHIYCLYFFDMIKLPIPLQSTPFLDDEKRGVFAMRTPFRPNPIGLSILEVISIKENSIQVKNVDILDGSPILDIKPYISQYDYRESNKIGWLQGKIKEKFS